MQHINQNPLQTNQWSYTNNTDSAQNIIVTLNGGDGALSKSTWVESDWTKYWSAGARGVSVQCFINDTLQEVAQGGLGNPQSVANQKVYSHTEGYKCGRYWYGAVKWCDRAVYVWGSQRAFPRGGSGDTKSFALNLGAGEVLKIVFVGGANITNTLFNGSVSLSFIPQTAPVIPEPLPEVQEPSPKLPETELPEVDSNEKPPIVEPESPQEQEPTISVEKREKAKAVVAMFDEFKSFWINNKTHTAKIGRFTMTLEQFHYRQTNGDLTPPYDEFVTYFLESQSLSNAWTFFHHASVELGEIFAKVPDTWVDGENLLELTYPQLLEIANGGSSRE